MSNTTTRKEKIPELHFERYLRIMRQLFGHNPVAYLEQAMQESGRPLDSVGESDILGYLGVIIPGFTEMYSSSNPEERSNARILSTGFFQSYHFNRQKRVFRLEEGYETAQ